VAERTLSRARAGDEQAFRELIDRTGGSSSCNEAVSLAFVAASSSCRRDTAVLVLRDVLGFRAADVAEMLETSDAAVKGVLQRART
jgi:predicted RNA polymerase sigma factor